MQNSNDDEDIDYNALISANVVTKADAIAIANSVANRSPRIMTRFFTLINICISKA